jgi:hypothetical protein
MNICNRGVSKDRQDWHGSNSIQIWTDPNLTSSNTYKPIILNTLFEFNMGLDHTHKYWFHKRPDTKERNGSKLAIFGQWWQAVGLGVVDVRWWWILCDICVHIWSSAWLLAKANLLMLINSSWVHISVTEFCLHPKHWWAIHLPALNQHIIHDS